MRIEGKIKKTGSWWAVEVPLLSVFTQGRTKKEAFEMVVDAVQTLVDCKGFEVQISALDKDTFSIGSNNDSQLIAFALRQQRARHNLSVREVSKRLGSDSPTAYSRYEQGRVKPSLDKFSQLLKAISEDLEPVLKIG